MPMGSKVDDPEDETRVLREIINDGGGDGGGGSLGPADS